VTPVVLGLVTVVVTATALRPRPVARRITTATDAPTAAAASLRRWSRRARPSDDLPEAIELIVLAVRAGLLPRAAIVEVVALLPPRVRPAFAEVLDRCGRGERLADALESLPRRLGPSAAPLADSLAAAERDGLPIGPVLDRLSNDARTERRRTDEAAARRLPVRMAVPLVLCTLPSFVLVAITPLLLAALSSLPT